MKAFQLRRERDQAGLVRPFADRWLTLARGIDDEQFWFSATLQRMAPTAVVDQQLLDDAARALADGSLHPSARQLLTAVADTGRRVLVARELASQ